MLLNIVTVFYLNQRDVREAVGAAEPDRRTSAAPARDSDASADALTRRRAGPRPRPAGPSR